jgi:hypothetical protein
MKTTRKSVLEPKDRTYILKDGKSPLTYFLSSRDTPRSRLLYYDEETNTNRPLRYARNANSPFQDEQGDNVIIEPIIFEDGTLIVPKNNPVLQEFLHYHPGNGTEFYEFDQERDAQQEIKQMYDVLDAQLIAREMSFEELEPIARLLLGGSIDMMKTSEIRRDMMLYAKRYPQDFMEAVNDPTIKVTSFAARAISDGYLAYRNNKKEIYYNLKDNKKKLLTVPFGEDPVYLLSAYLQSDEGLDLYKFLENKFSEN